ncbi:MAG: diguanylate cyclase [Rhodoferax sp.]|nr:diguanylate cyclase [Rhodoferax sp.]
MFNHQKGWLRFYLALTAFVVAVIGLTGYSLWLLRSDAIRSSLNASALMARSFENFLTQSISSVDVVAASLFSLHGKDRNAQVVGANFDHLLRQAPHLRSLSVIDAQDRIVISSSRANVGVQVAVQDFLPLVQTGHSALRVGKPWLGRDFNEPQPSDLPGLAAKPLASVIPLLYPLQAGDTGWRLLVALNPDFFVNHMLQQVDEQTGLVEVLRLDGVLLMSTHLQTQGSRLQHDAFAKLKLGEQEFGQFEGTLPGQSAALTAFRVSSLYPFVVVSHLNREVALQPWYAEIKTVVLMVAPSAFLVVLLALGYQRRQHLYKAQQAESQRLQRINAACVFDNTREGIIITSADGLITDVNAAFARITGYSRAEVIGKNPRLLKSGRQDRAFYRSMWQALAATGHWSGEIWNRRKDGEIFAEILTINSVSDSVGVVQQYVAVFTNITSLKVYQNELEHIARFDALTDLPNRVLLADRLQQAMRQAQRRQNRVAVVFIDLDGFKAINDQHGHDAGDFLLVTVSKRMRLALRDGDTLARNGGDEFVAVLVDLPSIDDALPLLERLLSAASQRVDFGAVQLQVSASVGVSRYPQPQATTIDDLLHQADAAMYQAKQAGKNQYVIYQLPPSSTSVPCVNGTPPKA